MINLVKDTILYVLSTLKHDAFPLAFGIIVACILNVYIDPGKFKELLKKRKKVSILGSVAFGAFTPLCACGTMAIIVSMLTTVLPWGPIMAFITSSPLMSPDLFVMLSGIIGMKFAIVLTISSILIGIAAGYISYYLEKHTKFFDNQVRLSNKPIQKESQDSSICCAADKKSMDTKKNFSIKLPKAIKSSVNCCSTDYLNNKSTLEITESYKICCAQSKIICENNSFIEKYKLKKLVNVFINLGLKQILLYFSAFAAVGYFINRFVPSSVIISLFGSNNMFSVPLAALIGIPIYVSDAGSIPLIQTLLDSGASGGAILAFMITGPGTSVGAIVGSFTIMKKKAVFFYVSILLISAVVLGYLYNILLFMGL